MNDITHSVINARGVSKTLPCSLALIFMPLTAGKPQPKPPAVKKVTITIDEVMALSVIAEYTDLEDMELAKVSHSPRKTRDLLIRMHQRRERICAARVMAIYRERLQVDTTDLQNAEADFHNAVIDLKALKL